GDPGPAFARDFIALSYVNHVNGGVDQFRAEGRGQVISAAFNQEKVQIGETALQLANGLQVNGRILANRRVRASPGLDTNHSVRCERAPARQELGVFARVDVVGDHRKLLLVAKP